MKVSKAAKAISLMSEIAKQQSRVDTLKRASELPDNNLRIDVKSTEGAHFLLYTERDKCQAVVIQQIMEELDFFEQEKLMELRKQLKKL